jgi:hypothetical protein
VQQVHDITETNEQIDAREMEGQVFNPKRGFRYGGGSVLGRTYSFEDGLKLCLEMYGSPDRKDIDHDHGYDDSASWVADIQRRLKKNTGITRETVIMLRESLPSLHLNMQRGMILWPDMPEFGDYADKRSGIQTHERIKTQRKRRGLAV